MEEEYFKVKVHHSGKFVKGKKVTYEGKDCEWECMICGHILR